MEYREMHIPFELVPFCNMNKKQAEQYFNWFLETKEQRIKNLQEYINSETEEIVLDKSPESLIGLWRWFETKIILEKKKDEEIYEELRLSPEWMRENILNDVYKLSILTMTLVHDISVYYGDVVIENNTQIRWGYLSRPKKLDGINAPRLLGFKADMSVYTYRQVEVCARKSIDEKNENRLINLYTTCKDLLL